MRAIQENKNHPSCPGWRVECLFRSGATLERSLELIEEWRVTRFPEEPRMIVLVTILCDVMEVVPLSGGLKGLKIRESVREGDRYPALKGFGQKIREVEGSLKRRWRELDIIWVNPYVIDVRRWSTRKVSGDGNLSGEEIAQLHHVSYEGAKYFEEANKIGTRVQGIGDRFYSWFLAWNDRHKKDLNYDSFMKMMPGLKRFGWINYRRTTDGLHPTAGLARQLVDMLYRKAVLCVPPEESLKIPVPRVPLRSLDSIEDGALAIEIEKIDSDHGGMDQLSGFMKKLSVVERLALSFPEPSDISERSYDLGRMGNGCCTGHGRFNSEVHYVKTSYPCGHAMPFDLPKENSCSTIMRCPVCDKEWSTLKGKCTSFHFIEFNEEV